MVSTSIKYYSSLFFKFILNKIILISGLPGSEWCALIFYMASFDKFFVISQFLVSIAIIFDFISFQCRSKNHINGFLFFSSLLISIHFILLDHMTAAMLSFISTIRFLTGMFTSSKSMMMVFLVSSLITVVITYAGFTSIISGLASALVTVAVFSKSDKQLRVLIFAGSLFWLLHNFLVFSPVAVLMEFLFIMSNVAGYYRYYGKH